MNDMFTQLPVEELSKALKDSSYTPSMNTANSVPEDTSNSTSTNSPDVNAEVSTGLSDTAHMQSESVTQSNTNQPNQEAQHTAENQEEQLNGENPVEINWNSLGEPIRVKGHELVFKSPEEVKSYIQRNGGAVTKLNRYEQFKPALQPFMTNGEFDKTKLAFANDVMSGNKQAILEVLKQHNVDVYDLLNADTDENGKEKPYIPSVVQEANPLDMERQEVYNEVVQGSAYEARFNYLVNNVPMFKEEFAQNPRLLTDVLRVEFESGRMDKILDEITRQSQLGILAPYSTVENAFKQVSSQMYPDLYGNAFNTNSGTANQQGVQQPNSGEQNVQQNMQQPNGVLQQSVGQPNGVIQPQNTQYQANYQQQGINQPTTQNQANLAEKQRISGLSNSKKPSSTPTRPADPILDLSPEELRRKLFF